MKAKLQQLKFKLGIILGYVVVETLIWTNPAFSQPGFEIPPCYMQTETGERVDLTHLCIDPENDHTHQIQSSRRATVQQQSHPVSGGRGAARSSQLQSSNSNQTESSR